MQDAAAEGDLFARESLGISRPVPVLVVVEHRRYYVVQEMDGPDYVGSYLRVPFYDPELLFCQLLGLVKYRFGYAYLAEIMKGGGVFYNFYFVLR